MPSWPPRPRYARIHAQAPQTTSALTPARPARAVRRIRSEHHEWLLPHRDLADLFGRVLLVRQWGRIGTEGRRPLDLNRDPGDAVNALASLIRAKRRPGVSGPRVVTRHRRDEVTGRHPSRQDIAHLEPRRGYPDLRLRRSRRWPACRPNEVDDR
ncbi:MAG: WGR domain-containing protein [Proteobacteria bacterium]|nr:WGR domain-containing protein [Pseudomonadota bacterium]